MKCDIIIPIWNQLDYTKDCILAIVKNTRYPYRLILVDNASDSETKNYLKSLVGPGGFLNPLRFPDPSKVDKVEVALIRNEKNLGFVKAVNQALKLATSEYICVFNNDTLPGPGWLERMVDFAKDHPDIGLINPLCGGHESTSIEEYSKKVESNKDVYMEMNQCQGFCMLLKKELLDKIGYLDEAYGIGGFDDTDYSMRAHIAGYRCAAIHNAYVYHRLHASFDKAGNREEWVNKNQKIYYDKWGKHLRVGITARINSIEDNSVSNLMKMAYGLAREWTWVHVWINSNVERKRLALAVDEILKKENLPPHQNIRISYLRFPKFALSFMVAGKILERIRKRMKDKRFDAIVIFDDAIAAPVFLCAKLLRASVVKVAQDMVSYDWLKKGKDVALYLKNRKKEYE